MITDEQRARIAQLDSDVLETIMGLSEPTPNTIAAQLPFADTDLADAIYELFTGDDDSATAPEAEPTKRVGLSSLLGRRGHSHAQEEPEADAPAVAAEVGEQATPVAEPAVAASGGLDISSFFVDVDDDARFDRSKVVKDVDVSWFNEYEGGSVRDGAPGVRAELKEPTEGEGLAANEVFSPHTVELTWDEWPAEGQEVYYRVVAQEVAEDELDPVADGSVLVGLTMNTGYRYTLTPERAFHEYQVWAYAGADALAALRSQPHFVGAATVIYPFVLPKPTPSGKVIEGSWPKVPGLRRMEVYRTTERLGRVVGTGNRVHGAATESTRDYKFEADHAGVKLRVQLAPVIVTAKGEEKEGPATEEWHFDIAGQLQKLRFEELEAPDSPINSDEPGVIYVEWIAPSSGQAKVYVTEKEPNKDLSFENELDIEALKQDPELNNPLAVRDFDELTPNERMQFEMAWPAGKVEVYVTLVMILGDKCAVGETRGLQRVSAISNEAVSLRENVGYQLLSFAWPEGATQVRVETAAKDVDDDDEDSRNEETTVTYEQYRQHGGIPLHLEPFGAKIFLTPLSVYAGKVRTAEEPTVLTYEGLSRFYYAFDYVGPGTADLNNEEAGLIVRVWTAERPDTNPPRFHIAFRTDRLPLHGHDNQHREAPGARKVHDTSGSLMSELHPRELGPDKNAAQAWFIPGGQIEKPGFIRLFMEPDDADAVTHRILTDEQNENLYLSSAHIAQLRETRDDVARYAAQQQEAAQPVQESETKGFLGLFKRRGNR